MVTFTSVLAALACATTILANPINLQNLVDQGISTRNGNGTHDGFFWMFWSDGQNANAIDYTNEPGGKYSVTWSNTGNFIGGKGWSPGTWRNVTYSGTWDGLGGNSYVCLYGWTQNPMVEYYVIDSYGTYNTSTGLGTPKATLAVDGGTYNIHYNWRVAQGLHDPTFLQVYSVRQQRRVGGTINTQAHFDAWVKAGARMGTTNQYQILGVEAYMYKSSGSASITVQGP